MSNGHTYTPFTISTILTIFHSFEILRMDLWIGLDSAYMRGLWGGWRIIDVSMSTTEMKRPNVKSQAHRIFKIFYSYFNALEAYIFGAPKHK